MLNQTLKANLASKELIENDLWKENYSRKWKFEQRCF